MSMNNLLVRGVVNATTFLKEAKGVVSFELIGSATFKKDPADIDMLVLVDQPWRASTLFEEECVRCASEEYIAGEDDPDFTAWRKGVINYVVTSNPKFYEGMLRASRVCTALKLERKADRVLVHRLVRDGWEIEPAREEAKRWEGRE